MAIMRLAAISDIRDVLSLFRPDMSKSNFKAEDKSNERNVRPLPSGNVVFDELRRF
jgi:hypothetical protein